MSAKVLGNLTAPRLWQELGAFGWGLQQVGEIRGSCVSPTRKDIRTSPAPWGLGDCASSASGDGKRAIFHPRNRNWGSYSQHRH